MQCYTVYLYLETALHVSGGTSTLQERLQLYLQRLVFVTPLLLSAALVEELEQVWVCCGCHTFTIIPLQPTRKENNWETKETMERATVTLDMERAKWPNPGCLWWWLLLLFSFLYNSLLYVGSFYSWCNSWILVHFIIHLNRFIIKYVDKGFACIIMSSLILLLLSVR
jgi:hypothetical protein